MIAGSSVGSLLARAGGNLTLGSSISASSAGDAITLVAGSNFDNSGNYSLTTAAGRWLVTRDDFFRKLFVLAPGEKEERELSWLDLSEPMALSADGKTLLFTEESGSVGENYAVCLRGTDGKNRFGPDPT